MFPAGHLRTEDNRQVANKNGQTITGSSYGYIVFDSPTTLTYALAYPAADLDKGQANLTVRHAGYVAAVTAAANKAVAQGYLLPTDAATLITKATNSKVLQ